MSYLTSLERSKIKFFTATTIIISDEYLSKDFDPFQYSQIQGAIANCETAFNAIGSTALIGSSSESTLVSTSSNNFPLQDHSVTKSISSRLSYGESLTRYYNSIDRLITALGYSLI